VQFIALFTFFYHILSLCRILHGHLIYYLFSTQPAEGKRSPAEMANIFLGMNEPDIQGSCMGNMFGTCVRQGSLKIITNP